MLSILNGNTKVPFQVIGSDAGLMSEPVTTDQLTMAMAERWEIVVDFASYANKTLTMKNARDVFKDEDYAGTDRVMQFRVGTTFTSTTNNGAVPSPLATLALPPIVKTTVDRSFRFERR